MQGNMVCMITTSHRPGGWDRLVRIRTSRVLQLDVLAEPGRVVVANGLRVSEGLQNEVAFQQNLSA